MVNRSAFNNGLSCPIVLFSPPRIFPTPERSFVFNEYLVMAGTTVRMIKINQPIHNDHFFTNSFLTITKIDRTAK